MASAWRGSQVGSHRPVPRWPRCFTVNGTPNCLADRIGLGSLADGAEGTDPELLRSLYRFARGELGGRVFIEKDASFARGWIDLSSPKARELVAPFIDADEGDVRAMRRSVQINLEAASWNDVLGIADPPISCVIRMRGNRWGMRFYKATSCMRGEEVLNEQLPPIPGDTAPAAAAGDAGSPPQTSTHPLSTPDSGAPPLPATGTNPLASAGFPT
jgi:hypothetical protein